MTECVIPGCHDTVTQAGDTCTDCIASFGSMLRSTETRMTAEEIVARDLYVARAYYSQHEASRGRR